MIDTSKLRFPKTVMVTDQEIDLCDVSVLAQQEYFRLIQRLCDMYKSVSGERVTLGFVGPTGSGKSVLLAIVKDLFSQIDKDFDVYTLGIDAFHFPNSILESKLSDSGEILKNIKGTPQTYDVEKLLGILEDFKAKDEVSLPGYSRKLHNPVEDVEVISTQRTLLLVEGLWLLHDEYDWGGVRKYLDYTFYIEADKVRVKDNVVKRHVNGGRSEDSADTYYESVDAKNFDLVEKSKDGADEVMKPYYLLG